VIGYDGGREPVAKAGRSAPVRTLFLVTLRHNMLVGTARVVAFRLTVSPSAGPGHRYRRGGLLIEPAGPEFCSDLSRRIL